VSAPLLDTSANALSPERQPPILSRFMHRRRASPLTTVFRGVLVDCCNSRGSPIIAYPRYSPPVRSQTHVDSASIIRQPVGGFSMAKTHASWPKYALIGVRGDNRSSSLATRLRDQHLPTGARRQHLDQTPSCSRPRQGNICSDDPESGEFSSMGAPVLQQLPLGKAIQPRATRRQSVAAMMDRTARNRSSGVNTAPGN